MSTKKSADSRVMHIGGFIFSTFCRSPVGCTMTPSSRIRSQMAAVSVGRRLQGGAVPHQFDAHVQPAAVDRADQLVAGGQFDDPRLEVIADRQRVLLQAVRVSITSSTVSPTTHDTGLPPAEEKK